MPHYEQERPNGVGHLSPPAWVNSTPPSTVITPVQVQIGAAIARQVVDVRIVNDRALTRGDAIRYLGLDPVGDACPRHAGRALPGPLLPWEARVAANGMDAGSHPSGECRCSRHTVAIPYHRSPWMPKAVSRMLTLLCALVVALPVGTNLGLLHLLWMLVSGRLLATRGAVLPGLDACGLSRRAVRRAWAGLWVGGRATDQ